MKKAYIGFDVGGTNIEAGLVSKQGKLLKLASHPTQNRKGKKRVSDNVIHIINQLLGEDYECLAICLGWPRSENVVLRGEEIKKILEKKFSVPIIIDNDANLFTLAESILGAGKNYSIVAGITMGTGVGGGLVIDKTIYHGRKDASEIGHTVINFDGPKCICGSNGCFEMYASSKAIKWLASKHDLKGKNGEQIYLLATQGDKRALSLWKEFGKYLGIGVISAINAYDPEVVVLGGQLSKAHRFFMKSMKLEIRQRAFLLPVPIKISKIDSAAIRGAALLAKNKIK